MTPPDRLTSIAADFWREHWPRLEAAGLVVPADATAFELLARTWELLQCVDPDEPKVGTIKFVALAKQFERLAKQFHLMPADRSRRGVSLEPKQLKDEFGL